MIRPTVIEKVVTVDRRVLLFTVVKDRNLIITHMIMSAVTLIVAIINGTRTVARTRGRMWMIGIFLAPSVSDHRGGTIESTSICYVPGPVREYSDDLIRYSYH